LEFILELFISIVYFLNKSTNIYDKKQKLNDSFYPSTALVGQAFMVSSDGWAVMSIPKYVSGMEKNWEGLDYQGLTYPINKVLVDNISNVLYLRLSGQGFRVVSFADWNNKDSVSTVWPITEGSLESVNIQTIKKIFNSKVYPVWQLGQSLKLNPAPAPGSILVNKNGELVGIADKDGGLVAGNLIERQIGFVLGAGKVNYLSLPWKGYAVYGTIVDNGVLNKVEGFYIADSPTRPGPNTVGAGDILIKLQQKPVDANNLSLEILSAPDTVMATVLRGKQVLDVAVEKSDVN
jgi:hypothetical protein